MLNVSIARSLPPQAFQLEQCAERLAEFHSTVLDIVTRACADDLEALQHELDALEAGGQALGASGTLSGPPQPKLPHDGPQYAYTIAALTRTEEWRLLNFVRMADYMICDTLHSVLVNSFKVRGPAR